MSDDRNRDFHEAILKGELNLFFDLLNNESLDINYPCSLDGSTALHFVISARHKYRELMARHILEHPKIKVNIKDAIWGNSPLNSAVFRHGMKNEDMKIDNTRLIELLLAHPDVDVNSQGFNDETPLYQCTIEFDSRIAAMLLEHPKIDVNLKSSGGFTPLMNVLCMCSSTNRDKAFDILAQDKRLDVNATNSEGMTAIFFAETERNFRILLDMGANINVQMDNGKTLLHYIIYWRDPQFIPILLSRPELEIKSNGAGKSPLDYARDLRRQIFEADGDTESIDRKIAMLEDYTNF